MESLFFNLDGRKYKKIGIGYGITKVDISQGLLYLNAAPIKKKAEFRVDFIDKMAVVFAIKCGSAVLKQEDKEQVLSSGTVNIFSLREEKLDIVFNAKSEVFVLFVADFFLRNYISSSNNNPINYLYSRVQNCLGLERECSFCLGEIESYLIKNILKLKETGLLSLKAEISVLELLVHFLEQLKIDLDGFKPQELELAEAAKEFILNDLKNPPTIKELAKLCRTNETKLKRVFKKVFGVTIYKYIRELRLNVAYRVLKEEGCTVAEAAKAAGYEHQGNFAKLFKEKFKIEPSLINKNPFVAKKY